MPGEFIDVRIGAKAAKNANLAAKLAEICPVSIFIASSDGVQIDESNLDECVLCDLCLEAAPKGQIKIVKLYEQ
jgi:Fe-S-cluster-containing hydrogenase component 2